MFDFLQFSDRTWVKIVRKFPFSSEECFLERLKLGYQNAQIWDLERRRFWYMGSQVGNHSLIPEISKGNSARGCDFPEFSHRFARFGYVRSGKGVRVAAKTLPRPLSKEPMTPRAQRSYPPGVAALAEGRAWRLGYQQLKISPRWCTVCTPPACGFCRTYVPPPSLTQ
jgi:hypothetical protein